MTAQSVPTVGPDELGVDAPLLAPAVGLGAFLDGHCLGEIQQLETHRKTTPIPHAQPSHRVVLDRPGRRGRQRLRRCAWHPGLALLQILAVLLEGLSHGGCLLGDVGVVDVDGCEQFVQRCEAQVGGHREILHAGHPLRHIGAELPPRVEGLVVGDGLRDLSQALVIHDVGNPGHHATEGLDPQLDIDLVLHHGLVVYPVHLHLPAPPAAGLQPVHYMSSESADERHVGRLIIGGWEGPHAVQEIIVDLWVVKQVQGQGISVALGGNLREYALVLPGLVLHRHKIDAEHKFQPEESQINVNAGVGGALIAVGIADDGDLLVNGAIAEQH
mmetsp:Transcript_62532/g.167497  ORF Transcript_62532/g.167497 Transcript_62532/m.167497 type:complete len:329 (+) Transcript_62532:314-1300(+)